MGEQSRAVLCVSIDNRRLDDSACDSSKKPTSTRPCMVKQCDSNPVRLLSESCRGSRNFEEKKRFFENILQFIFYILVTVLCFLSKICKD